MFTVLNQPSALNLHHVTLHVRTIFCVFMFLSCYSRKSKLYFCNMFSI